MRIRTWLGLARAGLIGLALTVALSVRPAEACGCGGYLPRGGDAFVSQEEALLRWDGATEDIVMTLDVLGGSKQAAVILPVPTRAAVKLGDAKIWLSRLERENSMSRDKCTMI